ncbi:MAG: ATP-binding protein [Lentimicrobium sp.]
MKREIIQLFYDWKTRQNRKPLIVRGARQVGKTYTITEFANEKFTEFVKINLEEEPELRSLFKSNKPENIINQLSLLYKKKFVPGSTLLFIDEIQSCPEALISLRYFYEQMPDLHVIAAGSLLDHTLKEMKLSMPVGRIEFCYMYPLNFREFLWALSETSLSDYLDSFIPGAEISESVHVKLLNLLRFYFFIGGMPEAVNQYIKTNDLLEVTRVHNNILTSLKYDFAKYGNRNQQQSLLTVLNYIAQNAGKKIKYVNIDKEIRSANLKEALYKLEMSRLITIAKYTSSPGVPLTTNMKDDIYKAYFLDTGLANHLSKIQLLNIPQIMTINEGVLAEQFVAQELVTQNPPFIDPALFYWLREEKNANAEVDFIFQHRNKIYPLEVKSGKTGTLKSMHLYLFEKKLNVSIRLNADLPSFGEFPAKIWDGSNSGKLNYKLLSLPIYMTNQISRLLDHYENFG